ncbi:unnamed protein product [Diplocarpon coronariae]
MQLFSKMAHITTSLAPDRSRARHHVDRIPSISNLLQPQSTGRIPDFKPENHEQEIVEKPRARSQMQFEATAVQYESYDVYSARQRMSPAEVPKEVRQQRAAAETPRHSELSIGRIAALEEILYPPDQIKKILADHLRSATRSSKTCYHEFLKDAPNPGLFLSGYRAVAFPILDRDIACIIGASEQSRIDPGDKINMWTVPNEKVELRNPSWNTLLASVLSKVDSEMGILDSGRGIVASKPMLILYGSGSRVNSGQCLTSKPTVFGFLDITLPSNYTGGEFSLSFDGKEELFKASEAAEYDCSCLAWFSNVLPASVPVTSGHRLVLRYMLEHKQSGPVCCAMPREQEILQAKNILTSWSKQKNKVKHKVLGQLLDGHYEDGNLKHMQVSKSDKLTIAHLQDACDGTGFYLCLSNLTARVVCLSKSDTHERCQTERFGYSIKLGQIFDLDGNEILGDHEMDFEANDIIQEGTFDDDRWVVDNPSHSNKHFSLKFFEKTVLIIMPTENRMPFLCGLRALDHDSTVRDLLVRFASLPATAAGYEEAQKDVRNICDTVLSTTSWKSRQGPRPDGVFSDGAQADVLKAVIHLNDPVLLERAIPLGVTSVENYQTLSNTAKQYGSGWLESKFDTQISAAPDFLGRCQIINKIGRWLSPGWVTMQYEKAMQILTFNSTNDVEGMLTVVKLWATNYRLHHILIPIVKMNLKGKDIILVVLSALSESRQVPDPVFQEILPQLLEQFIANVSKGEVSLRKYNHQALANVLRHCHALNLSSILSQIITHISNIASNALPEDLETAYLDFLRVLAETIDSPTYLQSPVFQDLYRHVINAVVLKCVPVPGPGQIDWALSPCGVWLYHTVEAAEFRRDTKTREHLEQCIRLLHLNAVELSINWEDGPPFGLRMKKIYEAVNKSRWTSKHDYLSQKIASLGPRILHQLIGKEHYKNLMALKPMAQQQIVPSNHFPAIDSIEEKQNRNIDLPRMPLSRFPPREMSRCENPCSAVVTRDTISCPMPNRGVQYPVTTVPVQIPIAPRITLNDSRSSASPPPESQITSPVISAQRVQVVDQRAGTMPRVSTTLPAASTGPGPATNQLDHNSFASKRKISLISVEDGNDDQDQENNQQFKRARNENPSGIIGGVLGAIDAPFPPLERKLAPPPPAWLIKALGILQKKHPNERFKALMLHSPVSTITGAPCSDTLISTNPADIKYMWLPRIACEDCPGKLYIPGSGKTVCNFQLHFKGVQHKTNVEERLPVCSAAG